MKQIIAVDIDEVLFPLTPSFMAYHNETYGTRLKPAHKKSDFLEEVTGETEAQMMAKIDAYLQTHHYANAKPVPGAVDAISRLSETYRLVIITARTANYRGSTESFVAKHFPGMFNDILYSFDAIDPAKYTPKKDLCKHVRALALVDDSLRNIQSIADTGVQGILFGDYAWNQHPELPSHVTRCIDWQAVERHLSRRAAPTSHAHQAAYGRQPAIVLP